MLRCQDDDLFPHDAALLVVDIVDFVKDEEFDIADEVSTTVKHGTENLCSHDEARSRFVDLHIARKDANVIGTKCLFELAELLVGQRLDR